MRVVADASPLIFLAKIRKLKLIFSSWGHDILVPRSVVDEVLTTDADPVEVDQLQTFLSQCRVETVRAPQRFASAMSRADNEALTLAIRKDAVMLLCDDKLTRRMAEAEGIRPMGTLGVLLNAMKHQLLMPEETRELLDQLIERHAFRIGINVYQLALRAITDAA